MAYWRRIIAKLRSHLANTRVEEDLAREVASHLTLLAEDFERHGMSAEEARLGTTQRIGGARVDDDSFSALQSMPDLAAPFQSGRKSSQPGSHC